MWSVYDEDADLQVPEAQQMEREERMTVQR